MWKEHILLKNVKSANFSDFTMQWDVRSSVLKTYYMGPLLICCKMNICFDSHRTDHRQKKNWLFCEYLARHWRRSVCPRWWDDPDWGLHIRRAGQRWSENVEGGHRCNFRARMHFSWQAQVEGRQRMDRCSHQHSALLHSCLIETRLFLWFGYYLKFVAPHFWMPNLFLI